MLNVTLRAATYAVRATLSTAAVLQYFRGLGGELLAALVSQHCALFGDVGLSKGPMYNYRLWALL